MSDQSSVKGSLKLGGKNDLRPSGSLTVSGPRELIVLRSHPCAYRANGSPARDTLPLMGEQGYDLNLAKPRPSEEEVADVCEEEVVWGGRLSRHFGHFLTESAATLWPLLPGEQLEGRPVVWTKWREQSFVQEWLHAFGARAVGLPKDGAVRFTRMFVPETAWRLDAWIAPEIRDIHLHVRQNLELPPSPRHDVLWISRSGLELRRVPYDECLLEWLLGEHVIGIRPETMTLAEQVAILESSRAVAGVVGSAFHTLLMTIDTPECLYLCPPWDKATFPAQHRVLRGSATFVPTLTFPVAMRRAREMLVLQARISTTPTPRSQLPKGGSFPGGYRVSIPETLRALSETVHPTLLEDPRLAAFSQPERLRRGRGKQAFTSHLDKAVAEVLLDPLSFEVRMKLGATFQAEGLDRCALEQFAMVAELSDEQPQAPLRAARLLHREGRSEEASTMAQQALANDPESREAADYVVVD